MTTVIGLTGGIASGKSLVSQILADHGALVIDADRVGHEAYRKDGGCYQAVVDAFGAGVVGPDGEIDRKALGATVFGDPAQRRRLEGIVWPWMKATMAERLAAIRNQGTPVVVLEAAVLIEAEWTDITDRVWVVVVPPELARQRIVERNGLTPGQADARIAAQLTNEERTRHADLVIENAGTVDELRAKVESAWEQLMAGAH